MQGLLGALAGWVGGRIWSPLTPAAGVGAGRQILKAAKKHRKKHFAGPVWWLAPLMFPIELIGNFARILSLSMRLFGNIFGEHTATGIFSTAGFASCRPELCALPDRRGNRTRR